MRVTAKRDFWCWGTVVPAGTLGVLVDPTTVRLYHERTFFAYRTVAEREALWKPVAPVVTGQGDYEKEIVP